MKIRWVFVVILLPLGYFLLPVVRQPESDPLLLVHVISAPHELDRRAAIRAVCPFPPNGSAFVLGNPAPAEADLLVLPIRDGRESMSLKRLLAFRAALARPWTWYMQTDSDSFIRYAPLTAFLRNQTAAGRTLIGRFMDIEPTRHLLPGYGWIRYPGGMAMVFTRSLVECVASLEDPILPSYPMDDVAIGLWTQACNATGIHTTDFHDWPVGGNARPLSATSLAVHFLKPDQMLALGKVDWNSL